MNDGKRLADVVDEAIQQAEVLTRDLRIAFKARRVGAVDAHALMTKAEDAARSYRRIVAPYVHGVKAVFVRPDGPGASLKEWSLKTLGQIAGAFAGMRMRPEVDRLNKLISEIKEFREPDKASPHPK